MKKLILVVVTVVVAIGAFAQDPSATTDTVPPYKKNPLIPAFRIMQPDSTWLTNANLPKNKPVVFIYFSPECGHCQLAAQEIASKYDLVKDAFFVWVSYYSVPEIKTFSVNYKIADYKNFRFGRDPQYFLPNYFRVHFTPFMAIYDNNGKFVQSFEQGATPETLAAVIHDNLHNKKSAD